MNPEKAYDEMIALSREETLLASCLDLLEWDEEVSMPRNGVEHRAEQRALLAGMVHDRGRIRATRSCSRRSKGRRS